MNYKYNEQEQGAPVDIAAAKGRRYYRMPIKPDGSTICPVCGAWNRHTTGRHCGHLAKITAKNEAWYWWNYKPVRFMLPPPVCLL